MYNYHWELEMDVRDDSASIKEGYYYNVETDRKIFLKYSGRHLFLQQKARQKTHKILLMFT